MDGWCGDSRAGRVHTKYASNPGPNSWYHMVLQALLGTVPVDPSTAAQAVLHSLDLCTEPQA